jgi:hypothetical protein
LFLLARLFVLCVDAAYWLLLFTYNVFRNLKKQKTMCCKWDDTKSVTAKTTEGMARGVQQQDHASPDILNKPVRLAKWKGGDCCCTKVY